MNLKIRLLRVEVVKAMAGATLAETVVLPPGANVQDALAAAADALGLGDAVQLSNNVGVFGERCSLERTLEDGDRVEVHRPLLLDAKAARRMRAKSAALRGR